MHRKAITIEEFTAERASALLCRSELRRDGRLIECDHVAGLVEFMHFRRHGVVRVTEQAQDRPERPSASG